MNGRSQMPRFKINEAAIHILVGILISCVRTCVCLCEDDEIH